MKNILFILLAICFISSTNAQIEQIKLKNKQVKEINTVFANYQKEISKTPKDWDKIVSYTYPKFFEFSDKASIITQLKKSFKNPIYFTTIDAMELHTVATSFTYKNTVYGLAKYRFVMAMHFTKKETEDEKVFENYVAFMYETFKNKHKEATVSRDKNVIRLDFPNKEIIVINDDASTANWKMIEYIKDSPYFYEMFLEKEVATYIAKNFK